MTLRLARLPLLLLCALAVSLAGCADTAAPVPTAPTAVTPTAVTPSTAGNVSPSSMGSQQMVERPFKMAGHSEVVMTLSATCSPSSQYFPMGCGYEGHGEGVASHLGEITTTDVGVFPIGGGVITAANEDQLMFVSNNATGLMTVTGGTGRFEGATGEVIGVFTPDGAPIIAGGTFTRKFSWTMEGRIKY